MVYNTIQHTKRLCDFRISLSSERPLSITQNSAESIGKTLLFIENQLVPCFSRNKLRFEVYLGMTDKNFSRIQSALIQYMWQTKVVKLPAQYVLTVIKTLCVMMKQCLTAFSEFTFTNFKIVCEIYYQLVVGIFCTNRLNQDLLISKSSSSLQKREFLLPRIKMNTDSLINVDWKKLSYKFKTLFKGDVSIISMLLNLAELCSAKVNITHVENLVKECSALLGPCFLDFFKEPPRDVQTTCLSLSQFLEKQALVGGNYARDACVVLLLQISQCPEIFEEVTRFLKPTVMFCKLNGVYFFYVPESSICDLPYIMSLTDRYSLGECERAVESFFLGSTNERFFQLEHLLHDVFREVQSLASDIQYSNSVFDLDLDGFLRCIFAQILVASGELLYLHQLVNGIRDLIKFIAIATMQANLLQVRAAHVDVWKAETD
jgi:hypothetical protein